MSFILLTKNRKQIVHRILLSVIRILLVLMAFSLYESVVCADDSAAEFIEFDDTPLKQDLILPDWFKLSFLELSDDLNDVRNKHKKGLIVYFGQKDCAYCKAHLEKNWGDRGIVNYTQQNFDVVAIDVRGDRPVADIKGKIYSTEKKFSEQQKANFTPTLLFYNTKGKEVLRLSGYHPPFQFRAALEYVADGHYSRESFRKYLARGESISGFEETDLNESKIFSPPPYALDRSQVKAQTPLVVFFEQGTCHPCNVLHNGPLSDPEIKAQFHTLDVVQLDIKSDTPVLTPVGEKTTARSWARELGIYYAPTLVFFDEDGKEILRIDSVVRFYRLNNVLYYILSKGYVKYPNFQQWRQAFNR